VKSLLEASWKSFIEASRKTGTLIGGFISLVFHPLVFNFGPDYIR
jgi:hypothetical protein